MFYAKHVLEWTEEQIEETFAYELDIAMYNSGSKKLKSNMKNTFQAGSDNDIVAGNEEIRPGGGSKVTRLTVTSTSDNKNFKEHSIKFYSMENLLDQIKELLKDD